MTNKCKYCDREVYVIKSIGGSVNGNPSGNSVETMLHRDSDGVYCYPEDIRIYGHVAECDKFDEEVEEIRYI